MDGGQEEMNESPDNPLSVLSLFNTDKKGLDYFIEYVANTIESGSDDPMRIYAHFKRMKYIIEKVEERIKTNLETEATKYPQRFEYMGLEIEKATTSTKYDYSVCGDPKWNEASKVKGEREAFLKALKEPTDVRFDDELITLYPPIKKTTEGLKSKIL